MKQAQEKYGYLLHSYVLMTNHYHLLVETPMGNLSRDIAIYLLKKHTCLTNRQIGEQFGNISYSAVAKAYWRFSERLKKDKMLRKKISEIMPYVKG